MANPNYYGLRFHSTVYGGPPPRPFKVAVASAYQASPGGVSVDLNVGDPVKEVTGSGNDPGSVALIAGTDTPFGVICGILPFYNASLGRRMFGTSLPGGTTWGTNLERTSYVEIIPVANVIFEAVCDDATTFTTELAYMTAINKNVTLTINQVSGSTLASPKIDISTAGTENTKTWRIVGLSRRIDVDYTVTNVPLLITANLAQQAPYTATGV